MDILQEISSQASKEFALEKVTVTCILFWPTWLILNGNSTNELAGQQI